ncbi:PucR family transcriptional regulator [Nocardia sp. 004]|uniref:PucR family transcriptional regulator n=1 Tax=Nocardia sp. 004 TaxID=3385978 RepID=UPI0039A17237
MRDLPTTQLLEAVADQFEAQLTDIEQEIYQALRAEAPSMTADPILATGMRIGMSASLRRFLVAVRHHDDLPMPDVPPEVLDNARALVHRGIDIEVAIQVYRVAQRITWQRWMEITAQIVGPRQELITVLDRSLQVQHSYINHLLGRVLAEIQREREAILTGDIARRGEIVRLILEGAPPNDGVIARRLRYDIRARHTAAIVWTEHGSQRDLDMAAMSLARAIHAPQPLTVSAGTSVSWVWIATSGPADPRAMADVCADIDPSVRIAIGPTRDGIEGFRSSHHDALAVYRLLVGKPDAGRFAMYQDLEVAALAGVDSRRAEQFVESTLGPLAADTPVARRLRETLRVYLAEADNAPRTAQRLHTHRNTILKRIERATTLLGYPPAERRLAVALALELGRWFPLADRAGEVTHGPIRGN